MIIDRLHRLAANKGGRVLRHNDRIAAIERQGGFRIACVECLFVGIVAATLTGMTTEQFQADVKNWLATAKDHRWKRPYTELTYQPMQEVLKYLRANGYKTYIVTGGGQDFVRVYSEEVYGIPPEQVVGSAGA